MGQIFCALVLFFVIFTVDARSTLRSSEHDDTLCSEDHPLYPFIKLFNDIPEEWKSENNNYPKKKAVCFTRIVTTEFDEYGDKLNKFSSYEITFGVPKKYENYLVQQKYLLNDGQEIVNYPPFEEDSKEDDITKKNVIYIRCSKNSEEPSTTAPNLEIVDPTNEDTTTINHDLDFLNDLEEICDEHLDTEILNSLPDNEVTSGPDLDNTRRNGDGLIEITSDIPDLTTTTTEADDDTLTEYTTIPPENNKPSGLDFSGITTELSSLITNILGEMHDKRSETTPSNTSPRSFSVSMAGINDNETSSEYTTKPEITTTQRPVFEEIKNRIDLVTEKIKPNDEVNKFIIELKNIYSPDAKAECFSINLKMKYGKCAEPIIPIRILTESKLPAKVELEFVEDLENNRDFDEILVSGRRNCYLLKNLTHTKCPDHHDDITTVLEIDDLPDNPNDDPYFTIEFQKQCMVVSKHVDVIECPSYRDTLPHLKTEHLPEHVRYKHAPGGIDVHVEDIIVHSFSHCLLFKKLTDIGCSDKPQIVLKENEYQEYPREDFGTTDIIHEDLNLPTYRLGDYSLERISDALPKSFEDIEEPKEQKSPLTTPCSSEDDDEINTEQINRTTRNLSYPTTSAPESKKSSKRECEENDFNCLMGLIETHAQESKARKISNNNLRENIDESTTPIPTTIEPTTDIKEIKIPNSRKLSKLLKTIVDESLTPEESHDLFKPDFIVKIACAEDIIKSSCFYVSKYIMQPTFDDPHDYNMVIEKHQLPVDAKIVQAPNLNIFEANETIYATSGREKFVLIKKKEVPCPFNPKDAFFILDTGSCKTGKLIEVPDVKTMEPSIVKYQKGNKVYCFDFDDDLRLHLVKCPENLSTVPVLSRPEDLKTICRSQMKNKGHNEQMKLLRRLNIVTDYNQV